MLKSKFHFLIPIALLLALFSCNEYPDGSSIGPSFRVSSDSISFDTIISTFGTPTKSFRIINQLAQPLLINKIELGARANSYFRLNIDGDIYSSAPSEITIPGHDSIFVFVEATFPDFNTDSVCFQSDSILISTANETGTVRLYTWSQDVLRISGETKPGEVWDSKRPYLVRDSVEVPYGEKLTIKEGVTVLFHDKAFLRVWGDIKVEGTLEKPVCFQGDRFDKTSNDQDYEDGPGQWSGIEIYPFSTESEFNFAVIKNSITGIMIVGSTDESLLPTLKISNTIIKNNSFAGIASYGARIECFNAVFTNNNVGLAMYVRGSCNFNHVTFNNHYTYKVREVGSVYLSNYFSSYVGKFDDLSFSNSIFYGNYEDELTLDFYTGTKFNVTLNHCLLKLENKKTLEYLNQDQLILNEDPLLVDSGNNKVILPDTLSPVIDQGDLNVASQYPVDLFGNSRIEDGKPDLGAVEFKK